MTSTSGVQNAQNDAYFCIIVLRLVLVEGEIVVPDACAKRLSALSRCVFVFFSSRIYGCHAETIQRPLSSSAELRLPAHQQVGLAHRFHSLYRRESQLLLDFGAFQGPHSEVV